MNGGILLEPLAGPRVSQILTTSLRWKHRDPYDEPHDFIHFLNGKSDIHFVDGPPL